MKAAALVPRVLSAPRDLLGASLDVGPLVLSLLGVGISSYLVYSHYRGVPLYCEGVHGCNTVQASEYAEVLGVPLALLGLLLYAALVGAVLGGLLCPLALGELSALAIFGLGLMGFVFSGYLTWVEVARIHAVCLWCTISACLLTIVFILSVVRLLLAARWQADEEEA
jgi:uncharacterized membrane protein